MHSISARTPFFSISFQPIYNNQLLIQTHKLNFHSCSNNTRLTVSAKKRDPQSQPLQGPSSIVDEVLFDEDDDGFLDDFDDGTHFRLCFQLHFNLDNILFACL